jgi:hypothetical protein
MDKRHGLKKVKVESLRVTVKHATASDREPSRFAAATN